MPRTARAAVGGTCYHVINRGNARAQVFHKDGDYETFEALIDRACQRLPLRVLAYCLMPNHFHLVLWPRDDGDLSRWMQWLTTAHVRRYHAHYDSSGHVWQGRFKAFPMQQDEHLLAVLRYVERNPVRAELVKRAEDWAWSSAHYLDRRRPAPEWLVPGPVSRPGNWRRQLNQVEPATQLEGLRRAVNRGTPWGTERWARQTAQRLGLESTLRPRGRPRKLPEK